MRTKEILLLLSLILLDALFQNGAAGEKVKVWHISDDETLTYTVQDIDRSYYKPQGVLDIVFSEHKKDTELFKKYESANNDKEIEKMVYSGKKVCFPRILIIKNNTAYIDLEGDSDYVSERSGTTGAYYFAATVVFDLTEFNGIDYVYFILDEGDHFGPGKYERIDFWRLMDRSEKMKYKEMIEDRLNAKDEHVARYVKMLRDIGDGKSIKELDALKDQMKRVGYGGCEISDSEFKELIDKTIKTIKGNIKSESNTDKTGQSSIQKSTRGSASLWCRSPRRFSTRCGQSLSAADS